MSARVCHSVQFIVLLDYDGDIDDERLKDELRALQDIFGLGDFIVLSTSCGKHAICLDKLLAGEAMDVVYASTCDDQFKKGIRWNKHRTWILRTTPKGNSPAPKYLYTVESSSKNEHQQSQAHAIYLNQVYGVNAKLTKPDGLDEIELVNYPTTHNVNVKDLVADVKTGKYN